jgi:hypothetical protein
MSTTQSSSVDICDGDNLAIILALYWVVYLIINAVMFGAAMYALRKCFEKAKHPGNKNKDRGRHLASRTSSRMSLVSGGQH